MIEIRTRIVIEVKIRLALQDYYQIKYPHATNAYAQICVCARARACV